MDESDKKKGKQPQHSIISHLMTHLANDISELLKIHFRDEPIEKNPLVREEKLWLSIVLVLSRKSRYRKKLFFQNLNSKNNTRGFREKITAREDSPESPESVINYAKYVLGKRITLAKALGNKTTAMHDLLVAYINQSSEINWHGSVIRRDLGIEQNVVTDKFFRPVANILEGQRTRLADRLGKGSSALKIKKERGSFVLKTNSNAALVAEELSLIDVFNAIPLPLKEQPLIPYWTADQPPVPDCTTKRLKIILQDNNKLYGLLMSCGLNPDIWLPRIERSEKHAIEPDSVQSDSLEKEPRELTEAELHRQRVQQLIMSSQDKIESPKSYGEVTELADLMRTFNQKRKLARQTGQRIESEETLFRKCLQQVMESRNEKDRKKENAPKKPRKSFAGFTSPDSAYDFYCINILPNYPEIRYVIDQNEQLESNHEQQYEPQNDLDDISQATLDESDDKNSVAEHDYIDDSMYEQDVDGSEFYTEYSVGVDDEDEFTLDEEDVENLEKLTEALVKFLDPVAAYFWHQTVVKGIRSEVVLNDRQFRSLITQNPTLGYSKMSDRTLLFTLKKNMTTAFRQYKRENQNAK